MTKKTVFSCFLALVLLAACSLTPKDIGKSYMFALGPVKTARQNTADSTLVVGLPATAPELDTYRVALLRDKKVWDYYAGARWAEFLPALVQDDMIKSIEASGLFKTVSTDQSGFSGGMLLKAEIRSFQAQYQKGREAPVVRIGITLNLFDAAERELVSSFDIIEEKVAEKNSLTAIHAAFQSAFDAAQRQLIVKLGRQILP